MTNRVLQADIEFAKRLIEADCEDSAIIASLCWRGVGADEAAKLVEDLRHGQQLIPLGRLAASSNAPPIRSVRKKRRKRRHAAQHGTLTQHHSSSSWRRVIRRTFRWGTASVASFLILLCILYVGYSIWWSAEQNAAEFNNRTLSWREWEPRLRQSQPAASGTSIGNGSTANGLPSWPQPPTREMDVHY